jgi:hypothetical protein
VDIGAPANVDVGASLGQVVKPMVGRAKKILNGKEEEVMTGVEVGKLLESKVLTGSDLVKETGSEAEMSETDEKG